MFPALFCLEFLLIFCCRLPRPVAYCSDVPVNAAAALCVRVMGSSVAFTSYRLVACEEYLHAGSIIDRVFRGYFNKFRVRRFVFAFLACFLLDSFLLQSTLHDMEETSPCLLWDDVSNICGTYIPPEVMSQFVAHEQRLVREVGYSGIARSQSPLHVLCKPYWSAMHPRPHGDNWDSSSFGLRIRDDGATLILQIAEQFEKFRSGTNGGVIFCGQPGWGMIRSLLAQNAAIDTHRNFICINGVDMLSMCESAGNVRKVFNFARASSPCVLLPMTRGTKKNRRKLTIANA